MSLEEYTDEKFTQKVREYDPMLWYAAKRYEIPGVLPQEDLYQEGLIALDDTMTEYIEKDFDSSEFTRTFKSMLYHRMQANLRKHKMKCRDWRVEVRESIRDNGEGQFESSFDKILKSNLPDTDYLLEIESVHKYIDAIEQDLIEASTTKVWSSACDALSVFKILKDPNYEIPEEVQDSFFNKFHGKLTFNVIAQCLSWDVSRTRRAIRRLRKHARKLAATYGFEVPA